ncbi:MAG: flagellar hook-basal body protein [Alicyclobacillus macrosporangiidus]|uniref:flagellar hook-basal body protein n=1 Tax=Alicyclobacillus macrosporangiidus TaxID=392015 RepID=UPI0026EDD488|nr:flagellar hook-basal body protein [Alicyclobacillus macrosporangiidus]MCL6600863.1 flagellar hook-basal body protein [Alicyclobacillus macrosporangiidus]
MQSLWTGLSALQASLRWLDRVSENVANSDTPGYAADAGSFADTFTQVWSAQATAPRVAGRYTPPGWAGGTGVLPVSAEKRFDGMPLQQTGNPLDLAVQGNAFFLVAGADGQTRLTRAGNFIWSRRPDGTVVLATQAGEPVLDTQGRPVQAPGGQTDGFAVGTQGDVSFGGKASGQRIALAEVSVPDQHLVPTGDNEYVAGPGANVRVVNAGVAGAGGGAGAGTDTVVQGALSMSNADLVKQMTDLIQAQRMFDLNAEALQITNRMMQDANGIKA